MQKGEKVMKNYKNKTKGEAIDVYHIHLPEGGKINSCLTLQNIMKSMPQKTH